jgi:hypothetical protein
MACSSERGGVEQREGGCWEDCPGKTLSTAKYLRSSDTHMRCEECSAHQGKDIFLCNSFVKGGPVNCHRHYHMYHHNKEFASTMVIN